MIPMIIHQIWIGEKPIPKDAIESIRKMNSNFEHILWTEEEIKKRMMFFECQKQIDDLVDYCAKVDIMRIEILNKYGGIYIDADTLAINKFDIHLLNNNAFCAYENTNCRNKLIGNSLIGFIQNHKILKDMIEYYKQTITTESNNIEAWIVTGPKIFTEYVFKNENLIKIFDHNYFYPIHHTGDLYEAHGKIYTCQLWNSTNNAKVCIYKIYKILKICYERINIIIYIDNLNHVKFYNCLESILQQDGNFFININILLNNSDINIYESIIGITKTIGDKSRNMKFNIYKLDTNTNTTITDNNTTDTNSYQYVLKKILENKENEFIIKIDQNNILMKNMLETLLNNLLDNPERMQISAQLIHIEDKKIIKQTNYKTISYYKYMKDNCNLITDFMNIESTLYRINALYNNQLYINNQLKILEDYKYIYNIADVLIYTII